MNKFVTNEINNSRRFDIEKTAPWIVLKLI
jgi:hypothetical protein